MPSSERRILSQADLDIDIPDFTFRPNVWTEAFLTGLDAISVEGDRVIEIGVGTGIVGIDLLKRGVREYIGVDLDSRILPVARQNFAKRVPEQLFLHNGYIPRILFEDSIMQLRETTLSTLVQAEEQGHEFFFFQDSACKERITVKEAEERRLNRKDSYHKIYVIEGKLN